MESIPMVSIAVITYNHSKYIRNALNSILMQQVNFEYEIVVGDDCSPDDTQDILREYQTLYPDKFKMILRPKNIGPTKNYYDVIMQCTGKYIAYLEGDDYWTDENKLQKQVDFLNANPQYIGTAHRMTMVGEDGQVLAHQYYPDCKERIYTLKHYGKGLLPGHFATLVYRNIYKENKYDYSVLYKAHEFIADRTIALILAAQGNIYCFDERMSCYRYVTGHGTSFSAKQYGKKDYKGMYRYYYNLADYCKQELYSTNALKNVECNLFLMAIGVGIENRLKPMIIFRTYKSLTDKRYVCFCTLSRIIDLTFKKVTTLLKHYVKKCFENS